ncbi:MAG: pentapeptide repeat-containing protein [Anaerovorax sp.]|nr:pentapeptide repeat-containing protein [Anaerovorax sp.]
MYFSKQDGFPTDKIAGQPCKNLRDDFCCNVHNDLKKLGLKGCIAYDCFGAGQKVAQVTFKDQNWKNSPNLSKQMFEVFLIMRQLHELLWYLLEASMYEEAHSLHENIHSMIEILKNDTFLSPKVIMELDITKKWSDVNCLLIRTSELVRDQKNQELKLPFKYKKTFNGRADLFAADLRKVNLSQANLRGACLIAADAKGVDFTRADLIGADLRDTDIRGADLSKSIFLTQSQINVAKGDINTKLPSSLTRPIEYY